MHYTKVIEKAQNNYPTYVSNLSGLVTLTSRDWIVFTKALDKTEKPRPKLSAAMKRHHEWQKR